MTSAAIADSFVSICALIGLLILRLGLKRSGNDDPVNARFIFGINILVTMLASRVLNWMTDIEFFLRFTLIAAGLIPLAMLLLCEGLMRRHAHPVLKWATALGAVYFAIMAVFTAAPWDPSFAKFLLVFQLPMLAALGVWVVRRDKALLTAGENRNIDRLSLSLLLILPFAFTDFRAGIFDMPVRLGGVAILFLCLLALSVDRVRVQHMQLVNLLILMGVSVVVTVSCIAVIADLELVHTIQASAVMLSAALLFQVYSEAQALRRNKELGNLMEYIARFESDNPEKFLRGLQNHPQVAGALILRDGDLDDFDLAFKQVLAQKRIFKATDTDKIADTAIREQVQWLFEKYSATHAFFAGDDPFRLVVLSMPSFADAPSAEMELEVVQRVAVLMSRGSHARNS